MDLSYFVKVRSIREKVGKPKLVSVLSCLSDSTSIMISSSITGKIIWNGWIHDFMSDSNIFREVNHVDEIVIDKMVAKNYAIGFMIERRSIYEVE